MVGRELLHYRIVRRLGEGGMGEVYLAEDTRLGRMVALKVLNARLASDRDFLARFEREARAVATLNHPNIVTLYALEEAEGVHFLAMEYVDGETLNLVIERQGASPEMAREFGLELADALVYAHGEGVTHRDLKPANIMVSEGRRVKILDFGLAKVRPLGGSEARADAVTELETMAGSVVGTLGYMSPEQAQALPADNRSDIFSLGIILYELATGSHPFPGRGPAGRLAAILRDEPAPPSQAEPGVDAGLNRVIRKCLEKDPRRRFQAAGEIVAALEVGGQPAAVEATVPRPEDEPIRSIAVLPFTDMSPERDQGYFCDGMAEELISGLNRIPGLRVASRTSSFRFRGDDRDVREIGEALQVESVLEGGVRKAGRRLRVTVQLVTAHDGYQLWSERFEREEEDIFAIQDGIARRVVEALELELSGDREARLVSPQTADLEAYDAYLKGRHLWGQRTVAGLKKSIEFFRQALDRDPAYARAWAGLADAHTLLGLYGGQPPRVVMPKAEAAAARALSLEPELAEARVSLGCVLSLYQWNWEEGGRAFETALASDPDYPTAHQWYAMNHLVPLGRLDEAREHAREAQRLDPLAPAVNVSVGLVAYYARQFETAIHELRQVVELEPGFAAGRLFLGRALVEGGSLDEAHEVLQRAVELSGGGAEMVAALGNALARRGESDGARRCLAELEERRESSYISPSLIAQIHAGLGDSAAACDGLERGIEERATDLAWLAVGPIFDELRDTPRFQRLLARMGLARG